MNKLYRTILDSQKNKWERVFINDYSNCRYERGFNPVDTMLKIAKEEVCMDKPLIITQKYSDFNGRIITKEAVLINGEPFPAMAQWDTGATYSAISRELVNKLNIKTNGKNKVETTNHSQILDSCNVLILLNDDMAIPVEASVIDNINNTGIDLLIGMDIISKGDFAISTYNGVTCFSFRTPSRGLIDFSDDNN